jgi:hypothetical protein
LIQETVRWQRNVKHHPAREERFVYKEWKKRRKKKKKRLFVRWKRKKNPHY